MRLSALCVLVLLIGGVVGCAQAPHKRMKLPGEFSAQLEEDVYPLDMESREMVRGRCPQVQLISYEGDVIPYRPALKVSPFFRERLQQFELVVKQAAVEVYGRAPVAIRHYGAYLCRGIRRTSRMSEHGLGNALDVWGFDFEEDPSKAGPLGGKFTIVLLKDWDGGDALREYHAVFLRKLVIYLAERPDIFRGMLGPGAPDHDNHFHFDVGRSRFIKVY